MEPNLYNVQFIKTRAGRQIKILPVSNWVLRGRDRRDPEVVRDMHELVDVIRKKDAENTFVHNVMFDGDVEMPSEDDFGLLCATLVECEAEISSFTLPSSRVSDVHVGYLNMLIQKGVVSTISVQGGLSKRGTHSLAQTIQEFDHVQSLEIKHGGVEIYVSTITRPIEFLSVVDGDAQRTVQVLAAHVLVCEKLYLFFDNMTMADVDVLAAALTRVGNRVQKLSLQVKGDMHANEVEKVLHRVVKNYNSKISEININVGGTEVFVYPSQGGPERRQLDALFVLLSARQARRIGTQSQLRRVPDDLVRLVGQMTVDPRNKFRGEHEEM